MCRIPFLVLASLTACVSALPSRNSTTAPDLIFNEHRQGWTSPPNRRGTLDILWSCGSTIILCCWSMLCLNVPGPQDTKWVRLRRRVWIFALALYAPEVVTVTAAGQYLSALESVREFTAAGTSDWSLQHAFFADMGGFILHTCDWVPFPINAKQLFWLIEHGYVSVSPAVLAHVKDKNKVDGMMRFIMVLQSLWFIANFFARLAQGLEVTVLELTTVAFIYSSLPMIFLWRHKPADVGTPVVLDTERSMAEILLSGGDAAREPYSNTPLDFIHRKEWAWSIYWSHLRHTLRCFQISAGPLARPVDRFSNFTTPAIPTQLFFVGTIYYLGFAAIFIAGWNISLPTQTEQLLWRVAGILCLMTIFAGEVVTEMVFNVGPYIKSKRLGDCNESQENSSSEHEDGVSRHERASRNSRNSNVSRPRPRTIWDWMRNNSLGQDPQFSVQLKAVLPLYILGIAYLWARVYIITEDFLELRSLPPSCYETPEWQQFIPHLG